MWSEQMFLDRLEMMRDALNQFEDQKQKAIEKDKERGEKRRATIKLQQEMIE